MKYCISDHQKSVTSCFDSKATLNCCALLILIYCNKLMSYAIKDGLQEIYYRTKNHLVQQLQLKCQEELKQSRKLSC